MKAVSATVLTNRTPMKRLVISLCASAVGCAFASQFPATAIAKSKEAVIFSFNGADGFNPNAGLIDVNGTLYGTTLEGGANCFPENGCGTVFSFDPSTDVETVLHSFAGGTDGDSPYASLIDRKGKLYGTTLYGGASCYGGSFTCGTVFALDLKTGGETVLYSFAGGTDGAEPEAGLIDVKGTLYGTTGWGGTGGCTNVVGNPPGCGTVFSVNPSTGVETVLHSFEGGTDGAFPVASLIDVKGTLYGTTSGGGSTNCYNGCGTVFAIDPNTGAETVLYDFCSQGGDSCTDGEVPYASLIDVKGVLYGATEAGGSNTSCSNGCGTVFSLDPGTGAETVLHSFGSAADGENPFASLIAVRGELYGTTVEGGGSGYYGTVFSLDPSTGAETVLHSFGSGADGEFPYGGVINVKHTLYGTTFGGGASGAGTVFALKKP